MGHLLDVQHLNKAYGEGAAAVTALADISLQVDSGDFLSIVGPSGCGKTTLLRCLSGLMPATSGTLHFQGKPIVGPPRGIAMVFQDYSRSLMPWETVRRNVEFPLFRTVKDRNERRSRAMEALDAVGIAGASDKHPWQLSGGMQQRVALARALAYRPSVLLMDEPFASVDAHTRTELEDLVLKVHRDYAMTIVFVTHDVDESVYLGDRVLVLTRTPTVVDREIKISLARPRDQVATKETNEFVHLRSEVARAIRGVGAPGAPDGAAPKSDAPRFEHRG